MSQISFAIVAALLGMNPAGSPMPKDQPPAPLTVGEAGPSGQLDQLTRQRAAPLVYSGARYSTFGAVGSLAPASGKRLTSDAAIGSQGPNRGGNLRSPRNPNQVK